MSGEKLQMSGKAEKVFNPSLPGYDSKKAFLKAGFSMIPLKFIGHTPGVSVSEEKLRSQLVRQNLKGPLSCGMYR